MSRPVLVIGGPPTTNGDMHIGHVAGPYVAADTHVRYLRAAGREVLFASGGDDSQTYVYTTAARLGTTPQALADKSWAQIKTTWDAMGIHVDGFAPTDDGYRRNVYDYVQRLYDLGKFRLRTVRLPYSEAKGMYLVEGLVGGDCPTCLADSRGGICEACGHPVDFDALIEPYSIMDPSDPVTYREAEILVFPLEEYREQLLAYHEARADRWRPHAVQFIRELLSRPLPDFPITYPVSWGMPAPFAETPGQTLNAWLEGMPASMYCHNFAQREQGTTPPSGDDAWRAEHDAELVFFVGFDNLYIWAAVHIAELIAHEGRYILPDTILCNEFYELENEKFSTSKGHVVWARDLVAEVPRDLVRFYLNLTAPEHARTNFSRAALNKIVGERLVGPWNELAATLGKLTTAGETLPVSPEGPARAAAIADRFGLCFELSSFSLNRAADLIVQHVERLRAHAARALDGEPVELGDLFLQLRALISGASPILIDMTARAAEAGGFTPSLSAAAYAVASTTAFPVPGLDTRVQPTPTLAEVS
ncbi:class I tRNA ligase family protein [Actinokineospora sp. UTMC 2448]|uniref:class I tRNA ligase family protein n=1 Tax=Actinokineospora sp. UTMC 2448 TaxID=2268449 RepID=UPI002164E694|nr:class I tRNA ligase family protein [Actinokineospora sp. UTMC 2448]UVS77499.1 Methionine--tRNA ligase [Actinokineospora sp. UTMC 2448]